MAIEVTYRSGPVEFRFQADTVKQIFAGLAALRQVFEVDACGECDSKKVAPNHREYEGNSFYSYVCGECGAQLDVGQKRDDRNLFLKRKDKDGEPIGKDGWYYWKRQERRSDAYSEPARNEPVQETPGQGESISF